MTLWLKLIFWWTFETAWGHVCDSMGPYSDRMIQGICLDISDSLVLLSTTFHADFLENENIELYENLTVVSVVVISGSLICKHTIIMGACEKTSNQSSQGSVCIHCTC